MKPLLIVLGVVGAGLMLVLFEKWRVGAAVVGLAMVLAGALRLILPSGQAGDLVVRSRGVDAAVLLALGFSLVGLANTIPPGH